MAISVAVEPRVHVAGARSVELCPAALRAMTIWPRLDRRQLSRCGCDTTRLAGYIARRTRMPIRSIEALLKRA